MNGPGEAWRMIGKSWALHVEDPKQWALLLRVLHAATDELPEVSDDTTALAGQNVILELSAHTPTVTGNLRPRRRR